MPSVREFTGQMRSLRIALGIGTVALGLVVLFWPGVTLLVVAIIFGIQLIVIGAMRIATSVTSPPAEGWLRAVHLVVGVLVLLAGVVCLRNPFVSLLSLILLLSLAWLIDGAVELVAAASGNVAGSRWLRVVLGIVSIVGALVLLFWPGLALLTFTAIGGWLLVIFGVIATFTGVREARGVTRSEPMRAGGSTAATA